MATERVLRQPVWAGCGRTLKQSHVAQNWLRGAGTYQQTSGKHGVTYVSEDPVFGVLVSRE